MADVGTVLAGPIGREALGAAQIVCLVFSCGGHALVGMIAFNASASFYSCLVNQLTVINNHRWSIVLRALVCRSRYRLSCPHLPTDPQRHLLPKCSFFHLGP